MSNRLSVCPIHRRLFWTAVIKNIDTASAVLAEPISGGDDRVSTDGGYAYENRGGKLAP